MDNKPLQFHKALSSYTMMVPLSVSQILQSALTISIVSDNAVRPRHSFTEESCLKSSAPPPAAPAFQRRNTRQANMSHNVCKNRWVPAQNRALGKLKKVSTEVGSVKKPCRRRSMEMPSSPGSPPIRPSRRRSIEMPQPSETSPVKPCRRGSIDMPAAPCSPPIKPCRRRSVEMISYVDAARSSPRRPSRRGSIDMESVSNEQQHEMNLYVTISA